MKSIFFSKETNRKTDFKKLKKKTELDFIIADELNPIKDITVIKKFITGSDP